MSTEATPEHPRVEIPAEVIEQTALAIYYAPHPLREWYPTIPKAAREVCRMRARTALAVAAPLLIRTALRSQSTTGV